MTVASLQRATDRERTFAPVVLAFVSDPVMRFLYPEPRQYLAHFPVLVEHLTERAFEHETAFMLNDYHAVALWLPPGVREDQEAIVAHLGQSVAYDRLEIMGAALEELEAHHPPKPHWYLPIIAVEPPWQHQGYASALLPQTLQACDRTGAMAYLESSNPRNIPLYERHGFQVTGEVKTPGGPTLWPMVRHAR